MFQSPEQQREILLLIFIGGRIRAWRDESELVKWPREASLCSLKQCSKKTLSISRYNDIIRRWYNKKADEWENTLNFRAFKNYTSSLILF